MFIYFSACLATTGHVVHAARHSGSASTTHWSHSPQASTQIAPNTSGHLILPAKPPCERACAAATSPAAFSVFNAPTATTTTCCPLPASAVAAARVATSAAPWILPPSFATKSAYPSLTPMPPRRLPPPKSKFLTVGVRSLPVSMSGDFTSQMPHPTGCGFFVVHRHLLGEIVPPTSNTQIQRPQHRSMPSPQINDVPFIRNKSKIGGRHLVRLIEAIDNDSLK